MSTEKPCSTLILFAHPDPQASVMNRAMLKGTELMSHVTVHDLYASYPDFFIDVSYERALLEQHQLIIFQHPLYMYSCPALMKEWIDVVLSKGYAHGSGSAAKGKYWRSVVTTGGAAEAYTKQGYNHASIYDILRPFELTAELCQMRWLSPLVLHWARRISPDKQRQHAQKYQQWLQNPFHRTASSEVEHGQ